MYGRHYHQGPPVTDPMLLSPLSNVTAATSNAWSRPPASMAGASAMAKKGKKSPAPPSEAGTGWLEPRQYNSISNGLIKKLLTLAFDDKETVFTLPPTYAEVLQLAENWLHPPEGVTLSLRVPVEYASVQASRLVHGPYLWISNEETYQIAIDRLPAIRIEIVGDAPPPPDEPDEPEAPPPPPVFEMPCDFDLELAPGHRVSLGTICNSEDMDMSRSEDGTLVDGTFWGCLKIVHADDQHTMEFSGTRITSSPSNPHLALPISPDFTVDHHTVGKLAVATRPSTVKCCIRINSPKEENVDVGVVLSPMWSLTSSFPPAERIDQHTVKWFVKTRPGGVMEPFGMAPVVVSEICYEATPDTSQMPLHKFVTTPNSYALPLREFVTHIAKVFDSFGLPLHVRSSFISANYPSFALYRNIAYRFMQPKAINRAIELYCRRTTCSWLRVFFMWRGISDEEHAEYAAAGRGGKEAEEKDWKAVLEWKEESTDEALFGVSEVSVIDCTA